MRSARTLSLILLAMVCTSGLSATVVHAEGAPHTDDETDTPKPKPKPVVRRNTPAAKPAPAAAIPAAPVPYAAYNNTTGALSPDMTRALTPAEPLPPPVAITPAPITMQPIADPPPPAPAQATRPRSPQPADVSPTDQISLKCETQVTEGKRLVSQGVFYIDLFPSPVFPDENADFKFLFVDPAHGSLIRDTICLDTLCPANVTSAAYYLVNRVTKHGSALRITLDRSNGGFYAEEIDNKRIGKDAHRGEKGYCTPQPLPTKLF